MYSIVVRDGEARTVYYGFDYMGIRFWWCYIRNKLSFKKGRTVKITKI